ncbi:hypothetical protein C8Q77DRAFT_1159558 [Trametes polyzona]|nr:hypothetical protein C8Q77DRAFT_1159558 [Trametes polyzona]
MLPPAAVVLLAATLGSTTASLVTVLPEARDLHPRATVNGSCISAPDDSCVSLVGLCVGKIVSGKVGSTAFWTDRVCTAAGICAGIGPVLDAACCAGTCKKLTDIGSLDYSNIYFSMVGDCALKPGGCSLTWQPFVDWFYNTIQATGTNIWPDNGDNVLSWWADIANWTGFCKGTNCVDGAIPYTNLNDWFHFSSSIIATSPGTPLYVEPFDTLDENIDNYTPTILWPCPSDDPDCSRDYGPPLPGQVVGSDPDAAAALVQVAPPRSAPLSAATFTAASVNPDSPFPFGNATHQPPNIPPPVYANGELLHLTLPGYEPQGNFSRRNPSHAAQLDALPLNVTRPVGDHAAHRERAITPGQCRRGVQTDIPTVLPRLTYFCNFVPNICDNIRAHADWDMTTDEMDLTYDPFDGGRRRNQVCTRAVKDDMKASGQCDPRQHDPRFWKVSCDEFPFSASLEGGRVNARVMAVSDWEQDIQGVLQSSITQLRRVQHDRRTAWGGAGSVKMCHRYRLRLIDAPLPGAPANAVGLLEAGSQFFVSGATERWVTDDAVIRPIPADFAVDTPYPATATAILIPKTKKPIDCSPCDSDSDSDAVLESLGPLFDGLALSEPGQLTTTSEDDSSGSPSPTSPPDPSKAVGVLGKRQASSCTRPTTAPPLPTTSQGAADVSSKSSTIAKAAAAAAAAALASASNPTAEQSAAAAAAIAAANVLGPAADALATAASDAALASALAASDAAVSAAQSAANTIFSFGPNIPDWLSDIFHHVSSAASAVASAMEAESNVINPKTSVTPVVDPSHNPTLNTGPPPGVPPAACFGAGSQGFLKLGDTYFSNANGKAHATLVNVGSDAFFGLNLPTPFHIIALPGCNAVYEWQGSAPLQPNFQVDCSTKEVGTYWNGVKQPCYYYFLPDGSGRFAVYCGRSIGNIYACLQSSGLYVDLRPAFINWATS